MNEFPNGQDQPITVGTGWLSADLPKPPPFNFKNAVRTIGPGAILLAAGIGGGEWIVGPALAVKFGSELMWIATIAILLQLVINLEGMRYTLYTGEPIYVGFLRLRPGGRFWSIYYCLFALLSLGWPALAVPCASTLFASQAQRMAGSEDSQLLYWIASGVIVLALGILSFGGTVERMLERFSYVMILFVFCFLLAVNLLFIPLDHWWRTLAGFFQITWFSGDMDWPLLAAVAATAGSGGIGNLIVTSWARDKGFGMARHVGAIPSAIRGVEIKVSQMGTTFPITSENLRRWKAWQRYVHVDQVALWAVLAFVGLFLNVNLATGIIPEGTDLSGMALGAHQAKYMAELIWPGFWTLTLLNGYWILFSTHLGNTDALVRMLTDVLWVGSSRIKKAGSANIGRLYYTLLLPLTIWFIVAIRLAEPLVLFKILANVSGFILAVASLQIFIVNRRFLPREVQSRWRGWMLLAAAAFYGFFSLRLLI